MKISYKWLSQFVEHNLSPEQISEILTNIGLEVDELTPFSTAPAGLDGLVIGHVKNVIQHPNADRLRVTQVDLGNGEEPVQIVCGAPNVAEGQKVVVATVGTKLYPKGGESFTIKRSKIRGEESIGMICAEDEIGIGESHEGIMVLPADTPVGMPFKDFLGSYEDWTLEIGLTPNRVDAASHVGVARDLSAYLDIDLKLPQPNTAFDAGASTNFEVIIEDKEACPRYSGIIIEGIEVKDSPQWLKDRLRAVGLSPISNVVDVTNFVMYELGHPLHAFDLSKIKGNKIIVRRSNEGEKFVTLDKQERKLDGTELMICNAEEPMALAGVFGGLESGISPATTSIFIESAYFNPSIIRRTSRKHSLFTDASFRYERGADPNITIFAMFRAAELIKEVAGGKILEPVYDVYPEQIQPKEIRFSYQYLNSIAGNKIPTEAVKRILGRMGMEILQENEAGLLLRVPTYKVDVTRPIDVVEEVMRIYTFDKIEFTHLVKSVLQVDESYKKEKLKAEISRYLSSNGFYEGYHLSFVSEKENIAVEGQEAVNVLNPISAGLEQIRNNMLLPGLKSLLHNINRQNPDVKLYEWGSTYAKAVNGNYIQNEKLALWITGDKHKESWYQKSGKSDIYLLKAYAEQILKMCGLESAENNLSDDEEFEYGLTYSVNNLEVLHFGKVSPKVLKEADIEQPVFFAEFDLQNILKSISKTPLRFTHISKYPKVNRDLALTVPKNLKYEEIKNRIKETGAALVTDISIFDVYQGEQVKQGFKSYAVRIQFEDPEKTLEDKRIDKIINRIVERLDKELGVEIRK